MFLRTVFRSLFELMSSFGVEPFTKGWKFQGVRNKWPDIIFRFSLGIVDWKKKLTRQFATGKIMLEFFLARNGHVALRHILHVCMWA